MLYASGSSAWPEGEWTIRRAVPVPVPSYLSLPVIRVPVLVLPLVLMLVLLFALSLEGPTAAVAASAGPMSSFASISRISSNSERWRSRRGGSGAEMLGECSKWLLRFAGEVARAVAIRVDARRDMESGAEDVDIVGTGGFGRRES